MLISKAPTIKCKKCGKIYHLEIDDFGDAETSSEERNMGYETQYTWEFQMECEKCNNLLTVTIEGWEYPVGIYNYDEFTTEGCLFIEKPELEIVFDNPYEEEL